MYEPLKITAYLRCGIVADETMPIDGILFYMAMRERFGGQDYTQSGVSTLDVLEYADLVPLKRTEGEQWYYHASFALWPSDIAYGIDYWNKRIDVSMVELVDLAGKHRIDVSRGSYRSYHMPVYYRHALYVWWYVCGERNSIMRLLSMATHIGKKTSQGWGRVSSWSVETVEDDWSIYGPNGLPMRAIPSSHGTLRTGYRPPYWDARNQELCIVP